VECRDVVRAVERCRDDHDADEKPPFERPSTYDEEPENRQRKKDHQHLPIEDGGIAP